MTPHAEAAPLLCVSKVREEAPPDKHVDAYLVHVQAEAIQETDAYRKVSIAIVDRETGERGEGCIFWRPAVYGE